MASPCPVPEPQPLPRVDSIGFSCADLEATTAFFCEGLGFQPHGEAFELHGGPYADLLGLPEARLRLQRLLIGADGLELTQLLDPGAAANRPGRPLPADSRSNDLWFQHICLVAADLSAALDRLTPVLAAWGGAAISTAPQRLPDWNAAAAGIVAFKFRDPEGHPLELLQFPPDKGESRWHGQTAADPVLGIDHTAIGIAATARSCRFYDDLLGLRLAGDGLNHGPEQERLDGLAEVAVRISSHRCPVGPGLECLDYRRPGGGRPMPVDLLPQDAAHWQVRLWVDDLEAIAARLPASGGRMLSNGIVELADQSRHFAGRRALQLADPDGHRLQLLEA